MRDFAAAIGLVFAIECYSSAAILPLMLSQRCLGSGWRSFRMPAEIRSALDLARSIGL
jgi:hypothetical protein